MLCPPTSFIFSPIYLLQDVSFLHQTEATRKEVEEDVIDVCVCACVVPYVRERDRERWYVCAYVVFAQWSPDRG